MFIRICYLVICFLPVFAGIGCNADEDVQNIQEYTGPVIEVDSALTFYSDSAIVRVKVMAARQLEFQNGDQEFPEGIYMEFFDLDGKISSTLKANQAFYNKEKDVYIGIGDVVVRNILKNEQLNTEELSWKRNEQKIFTDKFVRIETDENIHTGEGLTSDQQFINWKILKPSGIISIDTDS
ncbi:MAG: LPS export ABC transporter periplasmic protein LptC [Bacteroidota bacterium]|jgi:LPS export ABC transporter protein LptC|nr:LPS export ABC transporter periplasmic protein LptC [Bacteroidota bacterium]